MIVQESDILLAALDRRMQVDRVLALDPLMAIGRADGGPTTARTPDLAGAMRNAPGATLPAAANASQAGASANGLPLATRLPLGQVVVVRVVAVPQSDHVIAEIGTLRLELAWPTVNGIAPRPGSDITLRVLAHRPMLLFQNVPANGAAADSLDSTIRGGSQTRLSSDAISLQPRSPANEARSGGPIRFDVPILGIEIVPIAEPAEAGAEAEVEAEVEAGARAPARSRSDAAAHAGPGVPRATSNEVAHVVASMPDRATQIDLDQVIVARGTAIVDGVAAPLVPRSTDDAGAIPTSFNPLLLQGPAWPGQPVELMVRREREDTQLDNPVLDHWCGEVLIDLPNLGRVAAHLALSMKGLRVRIEGDDATGLDAMSGAAASLASAFAGADLRVAALTIAQPASDARRGTPSPGNGAAVAFRRDHG